MSLKNLFKKTWWFLWESDSIWSWLANIVLAFVLIKFVVYPGLGLLLGTDFPVVAVVSGSMEHDGSFDEWLAYDAFCSGQRCTQEEWYAAHGISKQAFEGYAFANGFNKGDIMILKGIEPKNIKIGNVIVFMSSKESEPIIHRVVKIYQDEATGFVFITKGDHNLDSGAVDTDIREEEVVGKAVFRIPMIGWVKIIFVSLLNRIIGVVS